MTAFPLDADQVRALLDSLQRLDRDQSADTGLTASLATSYRVQGALVALHAVLGDIPSDAVVDAMTRDT